MPLNWLTKDLQSRTGTPEKRQQRQPKYNTKKSNNPTDYFVFYFRLIQEEKVTEQDFF